MSGSTLGKGKKGGSRAVIYCRVSSIDQKDNGTSLISQSAACRKMAEEKGLRVVAEFAEDYSGLKVRRPEWNRVLDMAERGEFDILVAFDPDRVGRGLYGWAGTYGPLHIQMGIDVLFVINGGDELTLNIRAVIGGEELNKIRERTMRGKKQACLLGKVAGGGACSLRV